MAQQAPVQELGGAAPGDPRLSRSRAAVVEDSMPWRPIDQTTPRGVKLQLINKNAGVATYGSLGTRSYFWTHWAPLPVWSEG